MSSQPKDKSNPLPEPVNTNDSSSEDEPTPGPSGAQKAGRRQQRVSRRQELQAHTPPGVRTHLQVGEAVVEKIMESTLLPTFSSTPGVFILRSRYPFTLNARHTHVYQTGLIITPPEGMACVITNYSLSMGYPPTVETLHLMRQSPPYGVNFVISNNSNADAQVGRGHPLAEMYFVRIADVILVERRPHWERKRQRSPTPTKNLTSATLYAPESSSSDNDTETAQEDSVITLSDEDPSPPESSHVDNSPESLADSVSSGWVTPSLPSSCLTSPNPSRTASPEPTE